MSAEPGWYHAEGDPPDTIRLWNGTTWVGFPQRDPNAVQQVATRVEGPVRGQHHVAPFGVFAGLGLILPILAYAYQAWVFWLILRELPHLDAPNFETLAAAERSIEQLAHVIELEGRALMFIGISSLIAGVLFLPWFFMAYRNVSKFDRTDYESWWAIVVWFVPIINLRRPSIMMQELCDKSPRTDMKGAINPVIAWAWWLIFLASGPAIRLLAMWLGRATDLTTVQMILWIAIGLSILNMVAAGLAIRLVQQISLHQDLRYKREAVSTGTVELARV